MYDGGKEEVDEAEGITSDELHGFSRPIEHCKADEQEFLDDFDDLHFKRVSVVSRRAWLHG